VGEWEDARARRPVCRSVYHETPSARVQVLLVADWSGPGPTGPSLPGAGGHGDVSRAVARGLTMMSVGSLRASCRPVNESGSLRCQWRSRSEGRR
jgi:hypothetical protein